MAQWGRPKMSVEEHLGLVHSDQITLAEVKEITIQIYERFGIATARGLLYKMGVERVADLTPKRWKRYMRLAKERLAEPVAQGAAQTGEPSQSHDPSAPAPSALPVSQ